MFLRVKSKYIVQYCLHKLLQCWSDVHQPWQNIHEDRYFEKHEFCYCKSRILFPWTRSDLTVKDHTFCHESPCCWLSLTHSLDNSVWISCCIDLMFYHAQETFSGCWRNIYLEYMPLLGKAYFLATFTVKKVYSLYYIKQTNYHLYTKNSWSWNQEHEYSMSWNNGDAIWVSCGKTVHRQSRWFCNIVVFIALSFYFSDMYVPKFERLTNKSQLKQNYVKLCKM